MAQFSHIEESYKLLAIFLLPLLYIILKQLKKRAPPLPPGPTPWPVLGNIPQIGKLPHVSMANFAQTYGPLVYLRLGKQNMVVASSPTAAREVLKSQDRILSARFLPMALPPALVDSGRSSMMWAETCDDGWRSLRTICRAELFSVKNLDAQSCLREKKIMETIEHLKAKKGEVVDIGEVGYATVVNMFGNVMLSGDLVGLNEKSSDEGIKSLTRAFIKMMTAPNVSEFYPFLSMFDLQGIRKKTWDLVIKFWALWDAIIEPRKKTDTALSQNDFLSVLLRNNYANAQIRQMFSELFIAGVETSTVAIEWTMAELIKNPECMKKVREELDRELKLHSVKESNLTQLPYLQACIKETLRIHPVVPLLPHRAHEECQIMNYRIPKNSKVVVNVWAIGRDPSLWDEPLKFKPERFLDSTVDFKGNHFEYLPFGAGRRICPGLPMAGRQLPLILASLLQSFDWSLPEGNDSQELDMNENFGLTLKKEKPLLLIPTPRK